MKRCPTCDRTFEDDALSFCLHDGAGLVTDSSPASTPELQATMMAVPPPVGSGSYPPPPSSSGPGSGSSNPPPQNQSWATPSAGQTSMPSKSGGMNKKLIIGGIGCLGLAGIVVIVGIVLLVAFSGPESRMNPYKGDLTSLVPETVGIYNRVDVDILTDREKEGFGAFEKAIGVAYKDGADTKIEMFVGNYSTPKAAEAGLDSIKSKQLGRGFTIADTGSKKVGWRTVGTRYILNKDDAVGMTVDDPMPDGAKIVLVQSSTSEKSKKLRIVGWTNGTVAFVIYGEDNKAVYFEQTYDAAIKKLKD